MDHNLILCCDSIYLYVFTWVSHFETSPSPYKHATTCPRCTLATHSRHTPSLAHLLILTPVSESNKLLQLWRQKNNLLLCAKNCPLTL